MVVVSSPAPSQAQSFETADWAAHLSSDYRVLPNIIYLTANNWDAKLDVYTPSEATGALPTLIYIQVVGSEEARRATCCVSYRTCRWDGRS
jgi:hypothetical protein